MLRDYVGRVASGSKQCPLASCGARLLRTRDVERDANLQAAIERAPDSTSLWLRGEEVRSTQPPASQDMSHEQSIGMAKQKRKRQSTAADGERHSTRRQVIVL